MTGAIEETRERVFIQRGTRQGWLPGYIVGEIVREYQASIDIKRIRELEAEQAARDAARKAHQAAMKAEREARDRAFIAQRVAA